MQPTLLPWRFVGVGVPALVGLLGLVRWRRRHSDYASRWALSWRGSGMTVPRRCLSSSGMVTGISPSSPGLPSRARCQAAATARKA